MKKNCFLLLILSTFFMVSAFEKSIYVLICSRNNAQWVSRNLDSVVHQKHPDGSPYENYKIIYVDDASTDDTGYWVKSYLRRHNVPSDKLILIQNKERKYKMHNFYYAIHDYCPDDAIVLELDGDDWLENYDVFSLINEVYQHHNVWLTYGNMLDWPYYTRAFESSIMRPLEIPEEVVRNNLFRVFPGGWIHCALRTFYAGLFKKIKKEDLMYEGEFLTTTSDLAIMMPMFEMAGERFHRIVNKVYIHNVATGYNDHVINRSKQLNMDQYIRQLPRYTRLKDDAFKQEDHSKGDV